MEQEKSSNPNIRRIAWAVWGSIGCTVVFILLAFVRAQIGQGRSAGVFEENREVDLRPIAPLPDFTLINQDGREVSLADLRGQVWVADIIFTKCAGICPRMTRRMSDLQSILPDKSVRLVTLTTDPEFDRPEVLKRYGERFRADFARWSFLTGTKEGIARLAVDGMKLAAVEKQPEQRENDRDLFIHSELFVLVDKQGRLRGSVESYDPRVNEKILTAVKQLLNEK
jgi:protein SCO1/2